jgi:uncharacterized protein (TIGR02271 family)
MRWSIMTVGALITFAVGAGCQTSEDIGRTSSATPPTRTAAQPAQRSAQSSQAKIPVVQEELQVGKREVQAGGARVETRVTEQPVEQNVQLRDEHVRIDRQKVDRAPQPGETQQAFQNQSIEMTETKEEPVVAKRQRVTEEVTIRKDADQRSATVRDTVRSTDVQVQQQQPAGETAAGMGIAPTRYEREFQQHYQQQYQGTGARYEEYQPAYHYGYGLGTQGGTAWPAVESQAKTGWEAQHPGTWERFEEAIKQGWQIGQRHHG